MSLFSVFFSECPQRFVHFINHCKEPALCCLNFCIVFFFFIAFNSALMLILYFGPKLYLSVCLLKERERGKHAGRGGNIDVRETLTCCIPYVHYLQIVPTTEVCTLTGNQTHDPLQSRTTLLPTQPLRQPSTCCYISFIWLTLGTRWYPFCSSSRHYIRRVTRDFLFLDVRLPVMMKLSLTTTFSVSHSFDMTSLVGGK